MLYRISFLLLFLQIVGLRSISQEFSAAVQDNYILLQWKSIDKKADHFELQRRSRGGEFKTISLVLSDDSDSVVYRYKDKLTGSENYFYYRIKTYLTNGTESFSDILSVAVNAVQQEAVSIVADSAAGKFIPRLPVVKGAYLFRIYDNNGRLLLTQRSPATQPELILSKLTKGSYFMEAYHPISGRRYYGTITK
jgi:hypothetical protein